MPSGTLAMVVCTCTLGMGYVKAKYKKIQEAACIRRKKI